MDKEVVKTVFVLLGIPLILVLAYLVMLAYFSWSKGYNWEDMDWQNKGYTSIGDFFAASDIGRREIEIEGKLCFEYYDYKDGLPIKTVCRTDINNKSN
jgi:hypothetical protein